jgi:hypothetical protein
VKVQDEGTVCNKAVSVTLGVRGDGQKEGSRVWGSNKRLSTFQAMPVRGRSRRPPASAGASVRLRAMNVLEDILIADAAAGAIALETFLYDVD